jgi:NAD(P)H-dependent FMN reductase
VLKNTLDWILRPVFNFVLKNKPVTIIILSLAFTGGVRAQYPLRETLTSLLAYVVPGPEVVLLDQLLPRARRQEHERRQQARPARRKSLLKAVK